ncbi:unnamed protein product [Trichogramma brassicae]|uniref:DUF7041 domain-containing protein n=1 Tax=Trichogramma brassicae TaxID=86971 RepID=A0A6H5ID95_9HYME|nr:unnamed protein product [Trichogramma brassicae]
MILTVLDPETISEVSDIIRAPPAQDKYTTLKDAIVARLTDSPDTQLHKLLGTIELGDKKPSQLLLQMRTLAGALASNDVLRVRWLDLLPDSTRRWLTIIKNQTLDELAAVADELHAVGPSVMATKVWRPRSRPASPGGAASSSSNSVGAQKIAELRAAIVQLTEITREALQRRDQPRGRSRSRTQPRSQSRPRSPTPHRGSTEGYCWYHERYGDVAEQCRDSRLRQVSQSALTSTRTTPYSLNLRAIKRAQARWPRSSISRCSIGLSRSDSPSLPTLGASPAIDSQPRGPNSRGCSIGASSGLHRASGPAHCTSCRSPETPGGSRATTACSTPVLDRIDTLCPSSRTCYKRASARSFQSSICTRRFTRSRSQKRTSRRRPSRHLSVSSSF